MPGLPFDPVARWVSVPLRSEPARRIALVARRESVRLAVVVGVSILGQRNGGGRALFLRSRRATAAPRRAQVRAIWPRPVSTGRRAVTVSPDPCRGRVGGGGRGGGGRRPSPVVGAGGPECVRLRRRDRVPGHLLRHGDPAPLPTGARPGAATAAGPSVGHDPRRRAGALGDPGRVLPSRRRDPGRCGRGRPTGGVVVAASVAVTVAAAHRFGARAHWYDADTLRRFEDASEQRGRLLADQSTAVMQLWLPNPEPGRRFVRVELLYKGEPVAVAASAVWRCTPVSGGPVACLPEPALSATSARRAAPPGR